MLRTLRPNDIPQLPGLLQRNFPEEEALLGTNPQSLITVARRFFRWDARLALGVMNTFGRPVFRFLVVESDGNLAATTLLSFQSPTTGYISMVMVDGPYRRRGFAQKLLAEAARYAASRHRRFVALDVLDVNAPARALYAKEGYRPLREQGYMVRPLDGGAPIPPGEPIVGLRPIGRRDSERLAELGNANLPPEVRAVLPYRPSHFRLPPMVVRGLASEAESWVIDDGSGPLAVLRATTSSIWDSGHMTAPILAPSLDSDRARRLVELAVRWLSEHKASRVLADVPIDSTAAMAALTASGFHEAYRLHTLYRPIAG